MPASDAELQLFLKIALEHNTSLIEKARIEGCAVVIPFDYIGEDPARQGAIRHELVRNRRELLEALGYS